MPYFDWHEMRDIMDAADERGITPMQLIHDAVMNDLYCSASWGNERRQAS